MSCIYELWCHHEPVTALSQGQGLSRPLFLRLPSKIWRSSVISLEEGEQESFKCNTGFTAEESEDEGQKYYEAMHEDNYHIQDNMEDPLTYLASSYPYTM